MNIGDAVTKADVWLLDRVFQPFADRLGEKPTAFDIGMSMQLCAIVLDAAAVVAIFMVGGSEHRQRALERPDLGARVRVLPVDQPHASADAPGPRQPAAHDATGVQAAFDPVHAVQPVPVDLGPAALRAGDGFNGLANLVFVVGIYLVSCQPKPPRQRQTVWSGRRQEQGSL